MLYLCAIFALYAQGNASLLFDGLKYKDKYMRKFALCVHDLRVSEESKTREIINLIEENFNLPLTVHLIMDGPIIPGSDFYDFLASRMAKKRLDVVFHGLTHACPENIGKLRSFYHKHQAEYLFDSQALRNDTAAVFEKVQTAFGSSLGICPPCWLSCRKNKRFLSSLSPLFLESMFHIDYCGKRLFSPIVSLGSPNEKELGMLTLFAKLMAKVSFWGSKSTTRVAIHTCDFTIPKSMDFFKHTIASFTDSGFEAVLMRNLTETDARLSAMGQHEKQ